MKRRLIAVVLSCAAVALASHTAVAGAPRRAPFVQTLSNNIPLVFGMTADEAAGALGVPLDYVSGTRGNEILAAVRPSPIYIDRGARLFLQFRAGRLTGWKGDWRYNWMWD